MTRFLGHHVSLEMLGLWLVELIVCSVLGYVLLHIGSGAGGVGVTGTIGTGAIGVGNVGEGNMLLAATEATVLAVTAGVTSFAIGMYRPETFLQQRRMLAKTAVGAVLSFPAIWLVSHVISVDFGLLLGQGALLPLKVLSAWILLVVAIRLLFSYSLRMNMFMRRIVIIGEDGAAARTRSAIERLRNGLFEAVGTMPAADASQVVAQLRGRRVWGLVVTRETVGTDVSDILQRCKAAGIKVWHDADFWERQLRRVDIEQVDPDWTVDAPSTSAERSQNAVRRAADILLSLILLVFTLPLMGMAAILIKCDSPGPVLYRQQRVGLNGRVFTLWKFRSMRTDAERGGPVWAACDDARITRVGGFMRRTRIDELPQLMNVLRGEMSFIGPRPERPHFVERLSAMVPLYRDRTCVKPGLTGWAQVNYPYGASVEDARMKLSYDLYYVKHRSLFLDVLILFSTVRVILFQEGAR